MTSGTGLVPSPRLRPAAWSRQVRTTVAGWHERFADWNAEPRWTPRTATWRLHDGADPCGLPERWRTLPGVWWRRGRPMHGLYTRPAADPELTDQAEGIAVLNGWRCGVWRGPAGMPRFRSPLVSPWNPILAQGDGRLGPRAFLDWDEYVADAVLGGWKPYGYLRCTRRYAEEVADRAGAAPFDVAVSDFDDGWISLARTETLAELFPNLGDLVGDYAAVLPVEVFEREELALATATTWRPADFLDDFGALEKGPGPVRGLILGYPPMATAGSLLRPMPGWATEYGSLPPRWWPHIHRPPHKERSQPVGMTAALDHPTEERDHDHA